MITHEINKYNKPVVTNYSNTLPTIHYPVPSKLTGPMNKLQYAGYLTMLHNSGIKVGGYLVPRKKPWPWQSSDFVRIVDIQEVHHFVIWDQENRPLALEVLSELGTRFWTAREDWITVTNPQYKF